ncbi:MAG: membrane protein [Parcubacteria group bacterium Gr01-1014_13]|nr:MAG: membrane protein [Parcubacteria group bacterium Gr01-1014_13]
MLKTATELVVDSWDLYVKNWRKFLPFIIMLFLPTLILSALGTISLYLSVYLPSSSLASNIIILIVFAASIVFAIWVTIALARAISDSLLAKPTNWKETFLTSSTLIWPVVFTSFLVSLSVIGGTLLFILPGIIFAVWYSFASYAVIFEGAKGLSAMRASKALVVGRWWPIAWRLAIAALIFGLLNYMVSFALTYLIELLPLPMFIESASVSVLSSLSSSVIAPLSAAATLILYLSAKQNPVTQPALPPKV